MEARERYIKVKLMVSTMYVSFNCMFVFFLLNFYVLFPGKHDELGKGVACRTLLDFFCNHWFPCSTKYLKIKITGKEFGLIYLLFISGISL